MNTFYRSVSILKTLPSTPTRALFPSEHALWKHLYSEIPAIDLQMKHTQGRKRSSVFGEVRSVKGESMAGQKDVTFQPGRAPVTRTRKLQQSFELPPTQTQHV